MQNFFVKLKQVNEHIETESKKLMEWNSQEVNKGMEQTVSGITEIVSIMFQNEGVFLECEIPIQKDSIMTALGHMMQAMENKDEVMLLDALYYEILVQFRGYEKALEKIVC